MNFSFLLEAGKGQGLMYIGIFALFFGFLYLFVLRPQKKKEQEDQQMRDALCVGDEVTTIGGIIGKVISIKDETFVLETTKAKTRIRFLKGAIRHVDVRINDTLAPKAEEPKAETPAIEAAPALDTEMPESKRAKKKKAKLEAEAKAKTVETAETVEATEADK